jgi:hypothetical protein
MTYDPRLLGQEPVNEGEDDMRGMGDREKEQQAKRDKLHASALKREEDRRRREAQQQKKKS